MTHAPAGYDCPFCRIAEDRFDESVWTTPDDVVYRDAKLCAFISAGQFSESSDYPGHVLVIPRQHRENLYDLPDLLLAQVAALVRRVALAYKRLGAEGTSTRQHNEPAGYQDVWHFHQHVFPRYDGDRLYDQQRTQVDPGLRARQAEKLRPELTQVLADLPLH